MRQVEFKLNIDRVNGLDIAMNYNSNLSYRYYITSLNSYIFYKINVTLYKDVNSYWIWI